MVTRKTLLDEMRNSPEAFLTIKQRYKRKDFSVFLVYEGKTDRSLYRKAADSYLSDDWDLVPINATNKEMVLKTEQLLDWSYFDKSRILFFVDRDYDTLLGKCSYENIDNVYVTDGYSIENSLCTCENFIEICHKATNAKEGLTDRDADYLEKLYLDCFAEFQKVALIVTACQLHWKSLNLKINKSNFNIDNFIDFENGRAKSLSPKRDIQVKVARAMKVGEASLPSLRSSDLRKNIVAQRSQGSTQLVVRGKYLDAFFIKLAYSINGTILPSGSELKGLNQRGTTALEMVSGVATMPKSLKNFMKQHCDNLDRILSPAKEAQSVEIG